MHPSSSTLPPTGARTVTAMSSKRRPAADDPGDLPWEGRRCIVSGKRASAPVASTGVRSISSPLMDAEACKTRLLAAARRCRDTRTQLLTATTRLRTAHMIGITKFTCSVAREGAAGEHIQANWDTTPGIWSHLEE